MKTAQLYYEDVEVGQAIRPMFHYVDQAQCIEWGHVSNNTDVGHWHIWSNRHRQDPDDPLASVSWRGQDPTLHGQFKAALFEKAVLEWAGPGAWVRGMEVTYRVWDHPFELKVIRGKVVSRQLIDGLPCVLVDAALYNEQGQLTTPARLTVVLPCRT